MSVPRYRPMRRPPRRSPAFIWWAIIGLAALGFLVVVRSAMVAEAPPFVTQASSSPTPSGGQTADQIAAVGPPPIALDVTAEPVVSTTPAQSATPVPPLATPIQVPRASPFGPTGLTPDPDLAQQITTLVQGHSGRYGVAIKDLRTGRGVLIDPDADYPAASLFKLPVMYEVFKQRELGALSLDEVAYFTERQVDFDLGTLDRPAGAPITLREALERMVTISDNSSAILLTDRVGAFNINQDMADLGFSHTRLDAVNLTTSPQDMLNFFEMIARGQAVNPRTSLDMLELMGRQQVNDRIPRLLRRGTSVAHKTGNLPGIVNDVGIVSTADVSFAIAVMVNGTSEEGIAALTIAQIAADSLDYFESVQVPTPTPTVQATDTPVSTPTIEPSPSPVSTPVPSPTPARSSTPASVSPTRGTVIPTTTPRVTPTRAALS